MKIISNIKTIVDNLSIDENLSNGGKHSWGCKNQRKRLEAVCDLALQNYEGDILEIGCHIGLTTRIFCQLAKKYDRKVYTVDPWNGQQEGNESVYQTFLHNTKKFEDVLVVNRLSSFSPEGKKVIMQNNFAFCWVDGLHTYEACSQDIDSCSKQDGIIAVDDLRWLPDLMRLFNEKEAEYKFQSYYNPDCREGYYVAGELK